MLRFEIAKDLHCKATLGIVQDLKSFSRFFSSVASFFTSVTCFAAAIVILLDTIYVANLFQLLSLSCPTFIYFCKLYFLV